MRVKAVDYEDLFEQEYNIEDDEYDEEYDAGGDEYDDEILLEDYEGEFMCYASGVVFPNYGIYFEVTNLEPIIFKIMKLKFLRIECFFPNHGIYFEVFNLDRMF